MRYRISMKGSVRPSVRPSASFWNRADDASSWPIWAGLLYSVAQKQSFECIDHQHLKKWAVDFGFTFSMLQSPCLLTKAPISLFTHKSDIAYANVHVFWFREWFLLMHVSRSERIIEQKVKRLIFLSIENHVSMEEILLGDIWFFLTSHQQLFMHCVNYDNFYITLSLYD